MNINNFLDKEMKMAKKRNLKMWVVMAVLLAGMAPAIAAGGVIYVDADASPGGDGSSWEDAYKYLQDALAVAVADDQIWVAEGTYKPDANTANPSGTGEREATFQLINGVAIYGGYAGYGQPDPNERDFQLYETILSGDLNRDDVDVSDPCDLLTEPTRADNSYHVVTGSGTDATAVLDGFTITAGNANGSGPYYTGGGMHNDNYSSPTVTNCTFIGNSADWGAGIFNYDYSSPTVTNCTFSSNSAVNYGGGMCNVTFSSPTVTNCTFIGNSAGSHGGGMSNERSSSPTLTNCILWGDSAPSGAEIYNIYTSTPSVTYSDIAGGYGGTGNINDDPLFIGPNGPDGMPGTADDQQEGDVHLRGYSPCINAGDPAGNYSGQVDLDGQPRVAYGRVDMGADEVFPIAGDFEPDGDVDFVDFAIFAGNWLLGL